MTRIQDVVAANVRRYRKALNLSQEDLAEIAELHRTYIGGIEQGRANASIKNIEKVARALNVDPAVLFLSDESVISEKTETRDYSTVLSSGDLPAPTQQNDAMQGIDFALVSWENERVSIRPIEVANKNLTLEILYMLIRDGFEGDELMTRYSRVHREILGFLAENHKS